MSRKYLLAFLALLVLPAVSFAQQRPRLTISQVRVGFPVGSPSGDSDSERTLFKAGAWAPVAVDIKVGDVGLVGNEGQLQVTVETPDPDEVATNYTVTRALDPLGPNGTFTFNTYAKLASSNSDITVTLKGPDTVIVGPPYKRQHNGVNPGVPVFLTIGSPIPPLRQALRLEDARGDIGKARLEVEGVGLINRVDDMPDHWFGYDGVDLVLLSTTRLNDFVLPLASEKPPRRREALVEWVQRGGQLVVSVGKNFAALKSIPEFDGVKGLLPVSFKKTEPVRGMPIVWQVDRLGGGGMHGPVGGPKAPVEVAIIEPKAGRTYRTLVPLREALKVGDEDLKTEVPIIVQAPYGLGRVTVVAFDLEGKPFADWKGVVQQDGSNAQTEFWTRLIGEACGRTATVAVQDEMGDPRFRIVGEESPPAELVYQLQNHLENFEEVPVISFGWVALFILIYILVVGPLDYFFLKKVVKRLELTWITFPTVVIVVSAVAYFTAYQLKGHDLRIRKLDVVDVDLQTQQAVGRTWFTIFSPRIQHYTIGIEPAAPLWASAAEAGNSSVLLSWMERPQNDMYGRGRSRGQSLFRRAYDYEPNDPSKSQMPSDSSGLKGVPIQVWSTKSFTGTWMTPLGSQPLVTASLRRAGREVSGEITWQPGQTGSEAPDVHLVYQGRVLKLDKPLVPGKPVSVRLAATGDPLNNWLRSGSGFEPNPSSRRANPPSSSEGTVRSMLFYQALDGGGQRNNALRYLDQSWRVREGRDEVILVARLKTQQGGADEVTSSPESASRLWLGALPAPGISRPELVGKMRQETYLRVFIPVQLK
jgi:hypothetical protein